MGYNTSILVLNDALGVIEKDRDFGKKIVQAIGTRSVSFGPVGVSALAGRVVHADAATIVETHHADSASVVAFGGNEANNLGTLPFSGSETYDTLHILRQLASQLGYTLRKNPTKK